MVNGQTHLDSSLVNIFHRVFVSPFRRSPFLQGSSRGRQHSLCRIVSSPRFEFGSILGCVFLELVGILRAPRRPMLFLTSFTTRCKAYATTTAHVSFRNMTFGAGLTCEIGCAAGGYGFASSVVHGLP